MSVINRLANQNRVVQLAAIDSCVNQLAGFYRRIHEYHVTWPRLEAVIDTIFSCWSGINWSDDLVLIIRKRAAFQAFGDPMTLTKHQLQLRQFSTQYYNPLSVPLCIEPMGLPDETGEIITHVIPGGLINIPYCYIVGGQRSVLTSCTPQLKPMTRESHEPIVLDLTPQTYAEWIKYYSSILSQCCTRTILWSDTMQYLVCGKCRQRITCLTYNS